MELAQIEPIAQEIVNATAPLVGGRTINIMDTSGVIIASSDPKRIGSFHQGAKEVLEHGTPVRIHPEDLSRYPGAKEGVNLPIIKAGELLGVVGILGDPRQVEDAANLLGVYVGLYLDQVATAQRSSLRRELRQSLLRSLFSGNATEELLLRSDQLPALRLPMRVTALAVALEDSFERIRALERIEELLLSRGLIDTRQDAYGLLENRLLIVRHTPNLFQGKSYIESLYSAVKSELDCKVTIAIGKTAESYAALAQSYQEAVQLCTLSQGGCWDIQQNECQILYLMSSLQEGVLQRFMQSRYRAVCDGFGEDIQWIISTVEAYCSCQFSVTKAATMLHIHKNTLLYRIRKILSLMGLEEEQGFVREYYLKLLLIYFKTLPDFRAGNG